MTNMMHSVNVHNFEDDVNKTYGNEKLEIIFSITFKLKISSTG